MIHIYIYIYGNVTRKLPVEHLNKKIAFLFFYRKVKTGPVWGLVPVGEGKI
jgi:hypothetical protein